MNDDYIIELWTRMKPFITAKDRMDAADAFVAVLDEHGLADSLEAQGELVPDKHLRAATVSYYGIEEEDEDEDENSGW